MSRSLSDRARGLTEQVSGHKRSTPRPRQAARTRLMIEALEDRTLLSTSGTESIVPSALMEAGRYAAQEVMNYISSYESTLATAQQMVANLEQQTLLAVSRIEALVVLPVEQFIQQTLFPTPTVGSPSGQSSSMPAGVNGPTMPTSTASHQEPTATPIGEAVPIGEALSAGGRLHQLVLLTQVRSVKPTTSIRSLSTTALSKAMAAARPLPLWMPTISRTLSATYRHSILTMASPLLPTSA